MRRAAAALAAVLMLAGCAPTERTPAPREAAPAEAAGPLAWLAGCWTNAEGGRESWQAVGDDFMFGWSLAPEGEERFYEHLRIAPNGAGRLTYYAMPMGRAETPFALTSSEGEEAVFENPAHDAPKRIAYRRAGDRLDVTLYESLAPGAEGWSVSFTRGCQP